MRRNKWTPPATPTELEWAKLAAFIDGEGSIGIRCRRNGPTPNYLASVVVTNCDSRLIVWIKSTFKIGTVSVQDPNSRSKDSYNRQRSYVWEAYSRCAEWILENCFPHFILKAAQAEICLELGATIGHPGYKTRVENDTWKKREELKQKLHALKATPFPLKEIKEVSNG